MATVRLMFQPGGILFSKLGNLRFDDHSAIALLRILPEIVLVIVLRLVESLQRDNLCHNGGAPDAGCLEVLNHSLCRFSLVLAVAQDDRAILRSHVCALPIGGRWVMDGEKDFQLISNIKTDWQDP